MIEIPIGLIWTMKTYLITFHTDLNFFSFIEVTETILTNPWFGLKFHQLPAKRWKSPPMSWMLRLNFFSLHPNNRKTCEHCELWNFTARSNFSITPSARTKIDYQVNYIWSHLTQEHTQTANEKNSSSNLDSIGASHEQYSWMKKRLSICCTQKWVAGEFR